METILEYAAFGGSLLSAWLYGNQGYRGPIAGLLTCVAFIVFGYVTELYAAIIANVIFMFVHSRNFRKVYNMDEERWKKKIATEINDLTHRCFQASYDAGWWHDNQGIPMLSPDDSTRGVKRKTVNEFVIPAKLMLSVSESAEAMEGDRKDAMDDKLPHRSQIEVELADRTIRDFDLAGALDLDLGGAMAEKMSFNAVRPDHKIENRRKKGGKKY